MTTTDAGAVVDLMEAVWGDVGPDREPALLRIRHLVATDPGGAWVTQGSDGAVDGAALALVREGLWGLSLLIVRPDRQSGGQGRALMGAALDHGSAADRGLIISSEDPRALRTYWRAGFALLPTLDANGPARRPPAADPGVREGRWPADRELVDAASRAARGAAHGPDIDAMIAAGARLLVHDGGGFVLVVPKRVLLLAAPDERVSSALLRTALDAHPEAGVWFLEARQRWALDVVLEAGLALKPAGALCVRGEVGPLHPYLPSGAYL